MMRKWRARFAGTRAAPVSFLLRLTLGVLLLNLFTALLVGDSLRQSRRQYEEQATSSVQNLAYGLEHELGGIIGSIDFALSAVVDEYARQRAGGGIDAALLNAFIARTAARLPKLDALRIADAAGRVAYGSDVAPGSPVNVADRPHFMRLRTDAAAGLVVSGLQKSRINDKWVVVFARRIDHPDGSFAGMAFGAIALDQLGQSFSAVDVGRHGTVSLRDTELRILARHPLPAGKVIGAPLAVPPLQALIAAGRDAGGYVTDRTVDGVERKFAVRRIIGQPLYVVVGRATGEYLEPWRSQAARSAALLALFAATTLASAVVLYQASRRRKIALDALVREEAQLRASEARLNDAQRIAHVGNWELDLVHNVLVWSDEIYRMFEIDQDAFGASYEAFLDMIHPADRELVNRAYTESVASRTPYDIVHRLLMKDGRIKYVNERCETVYDAAGTPVRSMGTVHDITERKRAEDEIRELNRELEDRVVQRTAQLATANQELEAFAYSVSHDLRAPLRAIEGFSHILEEDYGGQLDGEGLRLLGVVRANAKRMECLIGDILDFSRMGRRELRAVAVDMNRLAHEVAEELQAAAIGRDLRFAIAELPPTQGDRAMIRQVLANLMGNAVKFTQPRARALVEVGGTAQAGENVYYVKDNGVGFDMRYADKLFGVFERLHAQEQFEGTGIGLAIVKRVVVRHGGRVWAQGAVGEGAVFSFALPRT